MKIPIEDVIDLHAFKPDEVPDLLCDYFTACMEKGIYSVRVIHGKGKGMLRRKVQILLERNPMVESFKDAPSDAGGWGATLVELRKKNS